MALQRDLVGYGEHPPGGRWPNGSKIAISIVLNYEEGSERSFALGDPDQESMTEWGFYPFPANVRNLAMESMYEYGSRVGVWRILDTVKRHDVPCTVFASALAFELAPEVARRAVGDGHEICGHGYRWEEAFRLSEEEERQNIRRAIDSLTRTCGKRPVGWYCRFGPSVNTRRLLAEEGGFLYDSDSYNDEIPYFVDVRGDRRLVVPYAPDTNDTQQWLSDPLATSQQFFEYLRDAFEVLYADADDRPRMMTVGLHGRITGRPGRIGAIDRFLRHVKSLPGVWFATREQIARAWLQMDASSDATARQPAGHVTRVVARDVEPTASQGAFSRLVINDDQVPDSRSTMGYAVFPVGSVTGLIRHSTEEVCFVVKGSGEVRTDVGATPFKPRDGLHIPAGRWHGIANTGDEEIVMAFSFPSAAYPPTDHQATPPLEDSTEDATRSCDAQTCSPQQLGETVGQRPEAP